MKLYEDVFILIIKLTKCTNKISGKRCYDACYEGITNILYKNHIEADNIRRYEN